MCLFMDNCHCITFNAVQQLSMIRICDMSYYRYCTSCMTFEILLYKRDKRYRYVRSQQYRDVIFVMRWLFSSDHWCLFPYCIYELSVFFQTLQKCDFIVLSYILQNFRKGKFNTKYRNLLHKYSFEHWSIVLKPCTTNCFFFDTIFTYLLTFTRIDRTDRKFSYAH